MKTTIAYKKHSAGILYIVITLFSICAIPFGISAKSVPWVILGAVLAVVCAILSIKYLSLPSDIIVISDDDSVILPKGVIIPLHDIYGVSYNKAHAKNGIKYSWGSVTLTTVGGVYKFGFVADCEEVSKRLTELINGKKSNTGGLY